MCIRDSVIPILNIGAKAIHIPFYATWEHEKVTKEQESTSNHLALNNISDILKYL